MAISYCNSLSEFISFRWGQICLICCLVVIELTHWLFISILKVNRLLCQTKNLHTYARILISADESVAFSVCVTLFPFWSASFPHPVSLSLNLGLSRSHCNAKTRETASVTCVWSHCNHRRNTWFSCPEIAIKLHCECKYTLTFVCYCDLSQSQ